MITRIRIVLVLLACLMGLSSSAHAGFIDYLDQLSGPGPFIGYGGDFRLYCAGEPSTPSAPAPAPLNSSNWKWLTRRCLFNDLPTNERPLITVNLSASYARSVKNDLLYAPGTNDTHVSVYSFAPAFWWIPVPPLAVGSAIGVNIFRGPTFSTFSRLQVSAVQVEIKPFAFPKSRWNSTAANIVTVRAGYELIPQGFDATDFGAIPGTFHTGHETLPRVMVLFDLGSWTWIR